MNRKLALLTVVLLAGALAACGDDEPDIGDVVEQASQDAADEATDGDASSDGGSPADTGGDPGACLDAGEVGSIVGFEVEVNPGSSETNCSYNSTDPEQIGGSVTYAVDASGGDAALSAAREILEQTFEDGNIEDADIGNEGFFFDAGIVVQLIFTDDDNLYTFVLGGLDLDNEQDSLLELADAVRGS